MAGRGARERSRSRSRSRSHPRTRRHSRGGRDPAAERHRGARHLRSGSRRSGWDVEEVGAPRSLYLASEVYGREGTLGSGAPRPKSEGIPGRAPQQPAPPQGALLLQAAFVDGASVRFLSLGGAERWRVAAAPATSLAEVRDRLAA
eukprot:8643913-Pyramimonas_sp.AAC.1